ncbi:unnamed protein product [Blepharisma stoltei]|uniref:Uncharacterized protein n=1 Tax=Blepharisma stoltei TaxID=1481888 RepID=A0AAU9JM50_9CILI|nr:unnamed protein product [Blepharisma stoltei]
MMVTSIANWDFQSGIADLTVSLDDEIAVAVKVDGLRDFVHYMINVYEYGRLPDENNCADKLWEEYFRSLPQGGFIDNNS